MHDSNGDLKKSMSSGTILQKLAVLGSSASPKRRSTSSSPETDPKLKIYKSFVKRIMLDGTENEQLDFLSTYPIFKMDLDMVDMWKRLYDRVCKTGRSDEKAINGTGSLNEKKKKKKKFGTLTKKTSQRINMTQFIRLANSDKYIKIDLAEISEIMNLMNTNHEDPSQINCLKLDISKSTNSFVGSRFDSTKTASDPLIDIEDIETPREFATSTKSKPLSMTLYNHYQFRGVDLKDLAVEMTRQCQILYNKITTHEIIRLTSNNIDKNIQCPNFSRLVNMLNKIAKWIPTEILVISNKTVQIEIVDRYIKLADELISINNYHIGMAIIAGLNFSSLQRLKYLWTDRKAIRTMKELESILSHNTNYSRYRDTIDKIKDKTKLIPYMGVISRDITFHLDGNTLIDLETQTVAKDIYMDIVKFLNSIVMPKKNYKFMKNLDMAKYMENINVEMDDDILYQMSLKILPPKSGSFLALSSDQDSITFDDFALQNNQKQKLMDTSTNVPVIDTDEDPKLKQSSPLTPRINSSYVNNQIRPSPLPPPKLDLQKLINGSNSPRGTLTSNIIKTEKSDAPVDQRPPGIAKSFSTSVLSKTAFPNDGSPTIKNWPLYYNDWSIEDTVNWLKSIGMGQYSSSFIKENITGKVLYKITEEHLEKYLQVNRLGDRLNFIVEVEHLTKITTH
jgi:hypothetical protein